MTNLSNPSQQPFACRVPQGNILAPSRVVREIIRKRFGDRMLEWLHLIETHSTLDYTFITKTLLEAPTGDCGCSLSDPDDAIQCFGCGRVICRRRHSASCATCSDPFCGRCLQPVSVRGARALMCEPHAFALTASSLRKTLRFIKLQIWG